MEGSRDRPLSRMLDAGRYLSHARHDVACIGDRYRIGEAEFEVTQPRVTCFRVGMRMGEPHLSSLLVAHHRPGFYLRVLTEGHVSAGDDTARASARTWTTPVRCS